MKELHRHTKWTMAIILMAAVVSALILIVYSQKKRFDIGTVKRGTITEAVYGLGTVKTHQSYNLKVGVAAAVKQIFVSEGQVVQKGDRLVAFENFDTFTSPIDGVVSLVDANVSELVPPQKTVIAVQDPTQRYIEVIVEQTGALRIVPRQKAHIVFETLRNLKMEGEVAVVYSRNEEFVVHINMQDLSPNILIGMTADVVIEVAQKKDKLLIPLRSIDHGRVIHLQGKRKRVVPIRIGAIDEQWAELIEGDIDQGDTLIMDQQKK